MTNKRYYFFQISDEKFFDNVRIKALEMDGPQYVLSFQRLVLKAIKTNEPGFLALDPAFDSLPEQIATLLSCPLDYATDFYNKCVKRHLFEETDEGIIIPLAKELTASRTEKADEMKKRRQLEKESEPHFDDVKVKGNDPVTKMEKCSPYIENIVQSPEKENTVHKPESIEQKTESKEKEISKSPEIQQTEKQITDSTRQSRKENKKADPEKEPAGFLALCERVVSYLNEKVGFKWHSLNKLNKEVIKERLSEGFTEQDFKDVVDVKTEEWLHNEKMYRYLCPTTLFGPKMDRYLQQTLFSQVYDANSTDFKLGNAVFKGEGHIMRGPDIHKKVPENYQRPKMAWQQA